MIRSAKEIPYFLEKNISYLSREFAAQASEWFNTFKDQIRQMHNAELNSKQPQIRHALAWIIDCITGNNPGTVSSPNC